MILVYILWAILNVALWLYFLYILYHSILTLKEKLGWGAIVLLFMGLQCNTYDNETETKKNSEGLAKNKNNNSVSENVEVLDKKIEIEKNWLLTKNLHVCFLRNYDTKENSIISAYTSIEGYQIGTKSTLDIVSIDTNTTGNLSHYTLQEETKWFLLALNILSNAKVFNGNINLKK